MDLTNLREQIDAIDTKIIELYKERMEICKNVGLEKSKTNTSVLDSNRESQIIYRLSSLVDNDLKLYVKELYEVMFATSRAYQSKYVKRESETVKKIEELLHGGVLDFPVSASVACQGIEGANSMTATNKLFPINKVT